jgi:hypothetical protein
MSARTVPFHCPYCGDQNLWPHEPEGADAAGSAGHGAWECRDCLRAFKLSSLGLIRPGAASQAQEARS